MSFQHNVATQEVRKEEFREEHETVVFVAVVHPDGAVRFEIRNPNGYRMSFGGVNAGRDELGLFAAFVTRVHEALAS